MAVERINKNPHLEVIPDFAGLHYEQIRAFLVNNGQTEEEALQSLTTPWTNGHQERIQVWDQQVIDEARDQEEQCHLVLCSRITGQLRFHLCASRDVSADANSCL